MRKARKQLLSTIEQRLDPLLVQHFCAVNLGFEDQALGIYEQMAFSAFHFLATYSISSLRSTYPCGLHRLAVHYACTRLRISLEAYSQTLAQGSVQLLPGTVDAPSSEVVVVDGLPGRELMRQQSPITAATHYVEDGVKELTQSVDSRPSASLWGREIRLYASPLGVGEVGWVSLSHAC